MAEIKDFYNKFFSSEIANGFSQLITDQYFSFYDSYNKAGLIQPNSNQAKMIDALKTIATGDLSSSTNLFNHSYASSIFKDEDYKSGYISFSDLNQKIHRIKDESKQAKVLIQLNNSEYHHHFIDDYANTVNQIKFHRNQHAHNKIQFLGKAKVIQLYGEIYHLLQLTEDKHKENCNVLGVLECFLNDFESQISFDIEEGKRNDSLEEETGKTEDPLSIKIDGIYEALNREIKFLKDDINKALSNLQENNSLHAGSVGEDLEVNRLSVAPNDSGVDKALAKAHNSKIANEVLSKFLNDDLTIETENLVSSQEDFHCVDMDENPKQNAFQQKQTNSQTMEMLISLRDKIRADMLSLSPKFEHWENILSKPIVNNIIKFKIYSRKDFENNINVRRYYDTHKEVMDKQLDKYWDSVQEIMNRTQSNYEVILNRNDDPWKASTFGAYGTFLEAFKQSIEDCSQEEKEKYDRFMPTMTDSLIKKFLIIKEENPFHIITIEKSYSPKEGYFIKKCCI